MMEYTGERVKELAKTAHVLVEDDRIPTLCHLLNQMGKDLDFSESGDTAWKEGFFGAVSLDDMREDVPGDCMKREDVLCLAPVRTDACVTVPRTVEGNA